MADAGFRMPARAAATPSIGRAAGSGYEHRSHPTARFWLSRSERSNLLLLGIGGSETRFHASTGISATQPMHLVCAEGAFDASERSTAEARRPVLARSLEVASIKAAAIPPTVALPVSDIGSHAPASSRRDWSVADSVTATDASGRRKRPHGRYRSALAIDEKRAACRPTDSPSSAAARRATRGRTGRLSACRALRYAGGR